MQLRYIGFDQVKNIREYRFERVVAGGTTERFVVTADLALFESTMLVCRKDRHCA